MKITIQEFKSLIREAIVEQKSSASTKLLKQSLLELSSAIFREKRSKRFTIERNKTRKIS